MGYIAPPRNATVYDADHHILGQLGYVTLPRRIALAEAAQAARRFREGPAAKVGVRHSERCDKKHRPDRAPTSDRFARKTRQLVI